VPADRPVRHPRPGPSAADRVAAIISAAEDTAAEVLRDTETRMKARIAEGERAAQFRIVAAEDEAQELVAIAQSEADRLAREGRERDEAARTKATNEALEIMARAQQDADAALSAATATAARLRSEAERESRERLRQARAAADAAHTEGLELVDNLRAMGDSLRSNADRLLRDVRSLHGQMIARIEVAEGDQPVDGVPDEARSPRRNADIDVPEFIPPR
jgi:hypothetical protein